MGVIRHILNAKSGTDTTTHWRTSQLRDWIGPLGRFSENTQTLVLNINPPLQEMCSPWLFCCSTKPPSRWSPATTGSSLPSSSGISSTSSSPSSSTPSTSSSPTPMAATSSPGSSPSSTLSPRSVYKLNRRGISEIILNEKERGLWELFFSSS